MGMPYSISSDHSKDYVQSGGVTMIRLGCLLEELGRARGEYGIGAARKEELIIPDIAKAEKDIAAFFRKSKRAALRQYVTGFGTNSKGNLSIRACRVVSILLYNVVRCGAREMGIMSLARSCAVSGEYAEILEYRRVIAYLGSTDVISVQGDPGYLATVELGSKVMITFFGGAQAIPNMHPALLTAVKEDRQSKNSHHSRAPQPRANSQSHENGLIDPVLLADTLKQAVVGQDSAINGLAREGCLHMLRRSYLLGDDVPHDIRALGNRNVLCIGPSGCGKTYATEMFCQRTGLEFVSFPATQLTSSGIVGAQVEDPLRILAERAEGDRTKMTGNVLLLDEIDKCRLRSGWSGATEISGAMVQNELLKVMDGTQLSLDTRGSFRKATCSSVYDSTGLMTLLAGAFTDIREVIGKLSKKKTGIGFSEGGGARSMPALHEALLEFFVPELVNRISAVLIFQRLTVENLEAIATRLVSSYNTLLLAKDIRIELEPEAIRVMSEACHEGEQPSLARGIKFIIGNLLQDALLSEKQGLQKFSALDVRGAIDSFNGMGDACFSS